MADSTETLRAAKLLSWILIGGFFLVAGMARGVYAAHGSLPSARFEILTLMGVAVFLWFWFTRQLAPYHPRLPMDMGAFVVVLWFVFLPYYLWRYERWRGLGKLVALAFLYFAAWAVSMVVYVLFRP